MLVDHYMSSAYALPSTNVVHVNELTVFVISCGPFFIRFVIEFILLFSINVFSPDKSFLELRKNAQVL